jgi:hypothetical protein|tara:strand:+ start:180 stop:491 length:312 start_codon:yes stop_codon:yes gene_type:complete
MMTEELKGSGTIKKGKMTDLIDIPLDDLPCDLEEKICKELKKEGFNPIAKSLAVNVLFEQNPLPMDTCPWCGRTATHMKKPSEEGLTKICTGCNKKMYTLKEK